MSEALPEHVPHARSTAELDALDALDTPALAGALRRRRVSLRRAMAGLEDAVAAPVRDDLPHWHVHVGAALAVLDAVIAEHLDGTEGPHGYYAGLLDQAPRLAGTVRRLRAEHVRIAEAFAAVERAHTKAVDDVEAVEAVREETLDLLALLARHRQHGSDLLWEAYGFDVGGEA